MRLETPRYWYSAVSQTHPLAHSRYSPMGCGQINKWMSVNECVHHSNDSSPWRAGHDGSGLPMGLAFFAHCRSKRGALLLLSVYNKKDDISRREMNLYPAKMEAHSKWIKGYMPASSLVLVYSPVSVPRVRDNISPRPELPMLGSHQKLPLFLSNSKWCLRT